MNNWQPIKAALTPHMASALHAEEAARNIVQVLEHWIDGDPTPRDIVADALWARRQHVRHLVRASQAATVAWVLTCTVPHERLGLLLDTGRPELAARELLTQLGLSTHEENEAQTC